MTIAPTVAISGLSNISYTENDPALLAASGITLSGGVNYANGYIEFKVTGNADIADQLAVLSSTSPTTVGAISVVGNKVYYGSGDGITQLGTIDSTYNGLNGQALRINLTSTLIGGIPIANGDFSNGLTNWTTVNDRVDLGNFLPGTTIPTPLDTAVTYPANSNGGDSGNVSVNAPWTVDASSGALVLENTDLTTDPFGVIHGPAAYSDVFSATAGKVFAFDWQANFVSDDYNVVGYLIDSSNNITIALSSTGSTGGGTATVTIPTTGDYRFVFISGTFDASGGTAAGASLFIDNIITADLAPIDDTIVSNLARQITYSSTSENPVASKTVTVSTTNTAAESTTGTFIVGITAVNDAPTVTNDYFFKIQSLTANNAQVTDVNGLIGDDRGGIAVSSNRVFLNGDNQTGSFDATTLGASVGVGLIYDGILQNIATGKIYTLSTDGINPATSSGGTFTHLLGINDATGALDGTSIALSSAITTFGRTGIFSGYNRAAIVSDTGDVFDINIKTGVVTTAGSIASPGNFMYGSENWANWGVAEYFDDQLFLAYRPSSGVSEIDRINVATGATETIGAFSDLGDLASFTVSPSSGKWYFHNEGGGQFGNFSEALGYADATFLLGGSSSTTIVINDNATATPFSDLTVADVDSPNASIAITYTDAYGTLAGPGLTGTVGNYTLTGANLADVNSKLKALVFTPTANQVAVGSTVQTTFTLIPNDGTLAGAANTSVVVLINRAPTDLALSGNSINENVDANSLIGTFSSTDPDAGSTFTYSFVDGNGPNDNSAFTISGNQLLINASPDFEAKSTYSILVRTTDQGGLTYDKALTININDIAGNLSVNNVSSISEGNSGSTNAAFTVSLSDPFSSPVTVNYSTVNGTALAGFDYTATSGTVTFAAGETSKTVNVGVIGDLFNESNETFKLQLSNSSNGTIANSFGTATIIDDDLAPTLNISNVTVTEGNSGTTNAIFTVTLSAASGQPITVNYSTADGTATIADNDYTATSGTLTFFPGSTALNIVVPIKGDANVEGDQTFTLNLSNASGATIAIGQGTAKIIDDDGVGVLTITGTSGADILTGSSGNDIILGLAGNDSLNGGAGGDNLTGGLGADVLTGGAGADIFVYTNFNESLLAAPDRIRDFKSSDGDRIDVTSIGSVNNLFNAGAIAAANLNNAVNAAFADADSTTAGTQALNANEAVFFTFGSSTYLAVNDGTAAFNATSDLLIQTTLVGGLSAVPLNVNNYFAPNLTVT